MSMLAIVVNDELMMEYHREIELSADKMEYLDSLDNKFKKGIEAEGQFIKNPNTLQRAQFIAMSMMEGIMYKEDKMTAVSLAWLATRMPDLKQIIAAVDHNGTKFEFIFDREYTPHVEVSFDPKLN